MQRYEIFTNKKREAYFCMPLSLCLTYQNKYSYNK